MYIEPHVARGTRRYYSCLCGLANVTMSAIHGKKEPITAVSSRRLSPRGACVGKLFPPLFGHGAERRARLRSTPANEVVKIVTRELGDGVVLACQGSLYGVAVGR